MKQNDDPKSGAAKSKEWRRESEDKIREIKKRRGSWDERKTKLPKDGGSRPCTCKEEQETNLIINCVPFCHQHSVDTTTLAHTRGRRKVTQRAVKFGQLVDSLISYERLTDEDDLIRVVRWNQLWREQKGRRRDRDCKTMISKDVHSIGLMRWLLTLARARINGFWVVKKRMVQCVSEREIVNSSTYFIILHSTGCVDEDDIEIVGSGCTILCMSVKGYLFCTVE